MGSLTLKEKIEIGERFAAKIRWRLEHYGAADFSDAEVARCMNANRRGMPPQIVDIAQAMVTYRSWMLTFDASECQWTAYKPPGHTGGRWPRRWTRAGKVLAPALCPRKDDRPQPRVEPEQAEEPEATRSEDDYERDDVAF